MTVLLRLFWCLTLCPVLALAYSGPIAKTAAVKSVRIAADTMAKK
jgi:hypothetical protein